MATLEQPCSACGASIKGLRKFCTACGAPMPPPKAEPPPPAQPPRLAAPPLPKAAPPPAATTSQEDLAKIMALFPPPPLSRIPDPYRLKTIIWATISLIFMSTMWTVKWQLGDYLRDQISPKAWVPCRAKAREALNAHFYKLYNELPELRLEDNPLTTAYHLNTRSYEFTGTSYIFIYSQRIRFEMPYTCTSKSVPGPDGKHTWSATGVSFKEARPI